MGIDAETLDICAIKVTTNATNDDLILPALLAQIRMKERIGTVGEDGGYDKKRKRHSVTARRHAGPSFGSTI